MADKVIKIALTEQQSAAIKAELGLEITEIELEGTEQLTKGKSRKLSVLRTKAIHEISAIGPGIVRN